MREQLNTDTKALLERTDMYAAGKETFGLMTFMLWRRSEGWKKLSTT